MLTNDLKPCPFCGSCNLRESKNLTTQDFKVKINIVCIQCLDCGCDGPTVGYTDPLNWNKRVNTEQDCGR